MRILYSLIVLMFMSVAVIGQSSDAIFITDAEISWLDKEVNTLKEALSEMQEAITTEDNGIIASKRTALIKSVNRMSTNSNIMRQKIETDMNPQTKRANQGMDNPPNYEYNKKKAIEGFQEIKLTATNWNTFADNANQLKVLKDKISENKYYFNPKYAESSENIEMISQMIALAEVSNSIIQRSQVE